MAQINVTNLTFGYDGSFDYIFENVSFSVDTDWKLGFIGRNGKGKTTFLHLLLHSLYILCFLYSIYSQQPNLITLIVADLLK